MSGKSSRLSCGVLWTISEPYVAFAFPGAEPAGDPLEEVQSYGNLTAVPYCCDRYEIDPPGRFDLFTHLPVRMHHRGENCDVHASESQEHLCPSRTRSHSYG